MFIQVWVRSRIVIAVIDVLDTPSQHSLVFGGSKDLGEITSDTRW